MASTGNLVSIKMVADRLMRNPLLKDLNYEFIVDNAVQVLKILKAPGVFQKFEEELNVEKFRALKPLRMTGISSIIRIDQGTMEVLTPSQDSSQEFFHTSNRIPRRASGTYSFNTKYINLNFETGKIRIIYKAVAVDEECYPMILDNETLLRAVESYIKWKWYDQLNDMDMISDRKLNKAETDYCFNIAQAKTDLIMPDEAEMEALTNSITQILPSRTQFSQRFEFLGSMEYMKIHGYD